MARKKPEGDVQHASTKQPTTRGGRSYTVVARRYRPQQFDEVVGQDHVVQALRNAIRLNRVAQAYLFSGTRGVGKTSMARIFAKALNCVEGPTELPCGHCEICKSIESGQDVDVIEIDGASNNGVEAVRELRQNSGLRPSRSRSKIYYIDEVHMLSTSAFNALLKTLEEPPSHVRFIFATTEPNKIPITVLSRCQRFDFAGIGPEQIVDQLATICQHEGVEAERDALRIVARRAAGSMRDGQSLLEQLLSSGSNQLTVDNVQKLLGIAPDDRVLDLMDAMANRDLGKTLSILDQAIASGAQPNDLLNSVIGFLRDVMVRATSANAPMLSALGGQLERIDGLAEKWSIEALLAAQQILDQTRGRLRGNSMPRILIEVGFCRVALLESMSDLGALIQQLSKMEAQPASANKHRDAAASLPQKKKDAESQPRLQPHKEPDREPLPRRRLERIENGPVVEPNGSPAVASIPNEADQDPLLKVKKAWRELNKGAAAFKIPVTLSKLEPTEVPEPGVIVIHVPSSYTFIANTCEQPQNRARIEASLADLMGHSIKLIFDREIVNEQPRTNPPRQNLLNDQVTKEPLAKAIIERFDAQLRHVEPELGEESKSDQLGKE